MKAFFNRGKQSALAWLAIGLLAGSGTVPAQTIPGRYIAVLGADTRDTPGMVNVLAAQHGLQVDHIYTKAIKGFAFGASEAAARALARRSEVAYVEADQVYTVFQQAVPTGIRRCDAEAVPGLITGGGLEVNADVAVIDTGLDGTHPDLNVQREGVRFYMRKTTLLTDAKWQDDYGHGTHVGGIIGARDNDFGVVGVAPGARLWAVKVLDSKGSGTTSTVIGGIDWVVQRAGTFEVANMSLGGGFSQAINDAVKAGTQAGIVFVVAAGNSAWDAAEYSPASEPTALTVSALDDNDGLPGGLGGVTAWGDYDDTLAQFSNYGEVVDVCAPGVDIYSTYPVSMGGYATMSGTSMAAPHVAGAAALYIARHGLTKTAAGTEVVCAAIRNSGWQPGHYGSFCDLLYYPRVLDASLELLLNVASLLYWNDSAPLLLVTPTDRTKVSGTAVPITVTTVPAGATAVQCYVDGQLLGQDANGSDGWAVSWNTTTVPDGPHTLVAVATDGLTHLAGDAIVVGVNNDHTTAPSVRITQPFYSPSDANPVPVSGVTNLAASAVDLGPVSGVAFSLDGTPIVSPATKLETGMWMLPWDTATVADGTYNLTAVAIGEDGSKGTSVEVPVAVKNHAIHVGAFSRTKSGGGGQWTTTATYTIHDAAHNGVKDATVYATWTPISGINTPGTVIPVSGITDANGQCSFTQTFGKKYYAAYFEITSVELAGFYYDPSLNEASARVAINSP